METEYKEILMTKRYSAGFAAFKSGTITNSGRTSTIVLDSLNAQSFIVSQISRLPTVFGGGAISAAVVSAGNNSSSFNNIFSGLDVLTAPIAYAAGALNVGAEAASSLKISLTVTGGVIADLTQGLLEFWAPLEYLE